MIGSIDSKPDLEIFLDPDVDNLPFGPVTGTLIKIKEPKRQGRLEVSVNDLRKYENGFGIGVYNKEYWGIPEGSGSTFSWV
jgi:hypothetical protein